jgi:rhodanese-related sulfurtransferase
MHTPEHTVELQKQFFEQKLAAERGKNEVVQKVKTGQGDFVLLDTRDRGSYAKGHIPGAIPMPLDEVDTLARGLDRSRTYVTYCWNAT